MASLLVSVASSSEQSANNSFKPIHRYFIRHSVSMIDLTSIISLLVILPPSCSFHLFAYTLHMLAEPLADFKVLICTFSSCLTSAHSFSFRDLHSSSRRLNSTIEVHLRIRRIRPDAPRRSILVVSPLSIQ